MESPATFETLRRLSAAISDFKADLAVIHVRALVQKYRPDQPRVPAGVRQGGQWSDSSNSSARVAMARRLTPELDQECEEQLAKDTFECTMAGSRPCHAQAAVRYSACRTGKYIPRLNY